MKLVLVIDARLPATAYGGTERVVYWLGRALAEYGHQITFVCRPGSQADFAQCRDWTPQWSRDLAPGTDLVHFSGTLPAGLPPGLPYLLTVHGNAKAGEIFPPNTVFVSQDHAQRNGWTEYVHNGLDLSEYPWAPGTSRERLLFLAKANWKVKNLAGALRISARSGRGLDVLGGKRPWTWTGLRSTHARFHGMRGGPEKLKLLQEARALLFPVVWDEPFGIALIEALACGAFVVGTPWGSLPEIISSECGVLSEQEEILAQACRSSHFEPEACRSRVENFFTHRHMAEAYLRLYKKILQEGKLREGQPQAPANAQPELMRSLD